MPAVILSSPYDRFARQELCAQDLCDLDLCDPDLCDPDCAKTPLMTRP